MNASFATIRADELLDSGVTTSRMFGTECLKVAGKTYAMEVKGALVVKLARPRAESLVASGLAQAFDPGHGRPMKQWIAVSADSAIDWAALVREAKAVVRGS